MYCAMADRRAAVPVFAVYRVRLFLIARMPASLMLSGVGKSGSPAPRSRTSAPSAFNFSAARKTARVDDDCIFCTRSETGNASLLIFCLDIATSALTLIQFLMHALFDDRRNEAGDRSTQCEYFLYQSRA